HAVADAERVVADDHLAAIPSRQLNLGRLGRYPIADVWKEGRAPRVATISIRGSQNLVPEPWHERALGERNFVFDIGIDGRTTGDGDSAQFLHDIVLRSTC